MCKSWRINRRGGVRRNVIGSSVAAPRQKLVRKSIFYRNESDEDETRATRKVTPDFFFIKEIKGGGEKFSLKNFLLTSVKMKTTNSLKLCDSGGSSSGRVLDTIYERPRVLRWVQRGCLAQR